MDSPRLCNDISILTYLNKSYIRLSNQSPKCAILGFSMYFQRFTLAISLFFTSLCRSNTTQGQLILDFSISKNSSDNQLSLVNQQLDHIIQYQQSFISKSIFLLYSVNILCQCLFQSRTFVLSVLGASNCSGLYISSQYLTIHHFFIIHLTIEFDLLYMSYSYQLNSPQILLIVFCYIKSSLYLT